MNERQKASLAVKIIGCDMARSLFRSDTANRSVAELHGTFVVVENEVIVELRSVERMEPRFSKRNFPPACGSAASKPVS
jgi:hypothetical protein